MMTADKWQEQFDAGAAAYDSRIAWSSKMPEPWRAGWIQRQNAKGKERHAATRHEQAEMLRRPLEGDC